MFLSQLKYFFSSTGFDSAHASKLFKPFQRLHSESEFQGSGIGLTIVEKIIEKHGGKIWAESKLDNGAEFFFSLPDNMKQ